MTRIAEAAVAAEEHLPAPQDDPPARAAKLERALDEIPWGLCVFDAGRRLIFCNRLYAALSALPPELTHPGTPLLDIMNCGSPAGPDPTARSRAEMRRRLEAVDRGEPCRSLLELADGRVFSLLDGPTADGGWLSTLEDVTERADTERRIIQSRADAEAALEQERVANRLLREAFEAAPQGLALMDDQNRFLLCNHRYEELYSESVGSKSVVSLEERLRPGAARESDGGWSSYQPTSDAAPKSCREQELQGGRWLQIEERRTGDGGGVGVIIDITDLKRRQESFRLLFDSNPVPMWVYDRASLRFLAVNDAAVEHYGYSRDQFLAMTILEIRPAEDADRIRKLEASFAKHKNGSTWRHRKADGGEILVATYARSINYEGCDGQLVSVIDVTERLRVGNELRRAREFLDLVIESVPEAIFVRDIRDRRFTLLNHAAEQFVGMARADVVGKTVDEIFPSATVARFLKQDEELFLTGEFFIDNHTVDLHGRDPRCVALTRKLLMGGDSEPRHILTVIHDITERKRAEERIAHLAHHDPLTDLPNRAAFGERLSSTLKRAAGLGERFAVLCIDLDRLKEVNDIFGHAAGDQMLCEISHRLFAASGNMFLARLGGDEFALIADRGAEPTSMAALGDRLLAAVESDVEIQGAHIRASLSIGVAIFPDDGRDATTLLANADAALYRAKAEGRGVTRFFKSEMDERRRERHALRHALGSAIERGELAMVYQPQADISGRIVGFEALLRWRRSLRGSVPPGTFIPVAEESGLIVGIGEWVLREVCREAATWPRRLGVAINMSPVQFQHGDLASLVHSILLETGLSANRLELEITEGVSMTDSSRALSVLRRLKALGVRIAVDDFGKGYSSLSYLQSFPFDKIKIDRAFVTDVVRNPQSAAIVRAVLGLARGLKLPVIAEGVETAEELAFLAGEACDLVQGYLIGRPRPIAEYAEIIGRPRLSAGSPIHARR